MNLFVLILAFKLVLSPPQTWAAQWAYEGDHGQTNWAKISKTCAGKNQSPIDIESKRAKVDKTLKVELKDFDQPIEGKRLLFINNGHTAQLNLDTKGLAKEGSPRVTGSAFSGETYQFLQVHFHWHFTSEKGSEHTINGKQYALEMHFVYINSKYDDVPAAIGNKDGLAVLGSLFQVTRKNNSFFDPIISGLGRIRELESNASLGEDVILDNLLPNNLDHFYKYMGSLTTPPCSEAVTWVLFVEPVGISEKQMTEFRRLIGYKDTEGRSIPIGTNFRKIQKIGKREILVSDAGVHLQPHAILILTIGFIASQLLINY